MVVMSFGEHADMDIAITVPKTVKWSDYEKELDKAASGEVMGYKVQHLPRVKEGARCYVVYDGFVRGWMEVCGLSEREFKCTTTGRVWNGKFVDRTGEFHRIEPVPMPGFRGFRYIKIESDDDI